MKRASLLGTKENRSALLQLLKQRLPPPPPHPPPPPLAGGLVHYSERSCGATGRNSHVNRPLALNRLGEEK